MVIDMHVHPGFYEKISQDKNEIDFRKKAMGWDLMSTFPVDLTRVQMEFAGVDRLVLLPLDLTTQMKGWVVTNEEVRQMMDLAPDLFYGFASVDPHRGDALDVLDYAFKDLKLMGLKLNPSKQVFYPGDPMMEKIYEKCMEYNKPIMFHAGLSWEPDCQMKYSQPVNFEEVAIKYPELRFCLAHFGCPWIHETTALVLKYANVYTDTAMLYMDSPEIFLREVLTEQLGHLWIEHNIQDKVMFGSTYPRIEQKRMIKAMESLSLRPKQRAMVMGENALRFMGMEV